MIEPNLISVTEKIEDEKMHQQFLPLLNEVEDWLDTKLGQVQGDLTIKDSMKAREEGHPYLEFIQEVQKEVTGVDISATALFDN